MKNPFKYLLILGLPIAVGTTLLASPIILLLYKSGFSQSIDALQILIWAIPLIFINYILGTAINSINKQRETVKTTFIAMILNIVLNVLLLPRYGLIAACYITVLTELTCFMLWYHIMNLNGYKFNILKLLYKPIIASLVMATCHYIITYKSFHSNNISNNHILRSFIFPKNIYRRRYITN